MNDVEGPSSDDLLHDRFGTVIEDRLLSWSRLMPHTPAYERVEVDGSSTTVWTWKQLADAIEHTAALWSARWEPGTRLVLAKWPACLLPVGVLGGLTGGLAVLPIAESVPQEVVDRHASQLGAIVVPPPDDNFQSLRPTESAPRRRGTLMLQTSGTTGHPAIVLRPAATVDQVARNVAQHVDMRRGDRVIAIVPMSHSYGVEHGIFGPTWGGATVMLTGGMDVPRVTHAFSLGATHLPGVPAFYERLCALVDPPRPSLRVAYSAGAPLPPSLHHRINERMGLKVAQLYGSTEVGSVTYTPVDDPQFDHRSVGRAFPGVQIAVVDDSGKTCAPNAEGEVIIDSPSMLIGYADHPVHWHAHGFPTADLGRLSRDGLLTITGRKRLLIDVGAAKVNPMEVEAVLMEYPTIAACIVAGIAQTECVQRVKAWVELKPGIERSEGDALELRTFLRERLAPFKVPRIIEFVDSLPRSATGKILRGSITS